MRASALYILSLKDFNNNIKQMKNYKTMTDQELKDSLDHMIITCNKSWYTILLAEQANRLKLIK